MEIKEGEDRSERIAVLRQTRLFGGLAKGVLEEVIESLRPIQLQEGDLLFSAGDPSRGLYIVAKGRTRALRHGADGREQVIHEDGPGSTFPEVAVFDDGPCPSTVLALEDSLLFLLPGERVRELCLEYPELALAALRSMSTRLRRATALAEDLALKDVPQRVAEYLLGELARIGTLEPNRGHFELVHTNQEIADRVGSVREVVSRSFAKLQRSDLLAKRGRKVRILDVEKLRDFVEGDLWK